MWLSKKISQSQENEKAETGNVTLSGGVLEADSSLRAREIRAYSPYGYSAIPPVGEEVMLIPSAGGQSIIGTRLVAESLETGEIQLSSKGGAKIILKNDGSVVINSLVIDKDGVIVQ